MLVYGCRLRSHTTPYDAACRQLFAAFAMFTPERRCRMSHDTPLFTLFVCRDAADDMPAEIDTIMMMPRCIRVHYLMPRHAIASLRRHVVTLYADDELTLVLFRLFACLRQRDGC